MDMTISNEKIFADAYQLAEKASGLFTTDGGGYGFHVGSVNVYDKRKAFTKWLLNENLGRWDDFNACVIVDLPLGYNNYFWATRFADTFCAELKKHGIDAYNGVRLD